jgi:hypothetical protein
MPVFSEITYISASHDATGEVVNMNKRLMILIAIIFAALVVSGCCVCCVPCGRTRYAYAPGEILDPVRNAFNVSASPVPGNGAYNATLIP